MTRVAAVDCGTNSIRLLVADVDPATGELVDLDRRMKIVRLGQGVDRTGRLAPEALERTFAACREYAAVIERARRRAASASWPPPPPATRRTATSSSRACWTSSASSPRSITGDAGGGVLLHRGHQGADRRRRTWPTPYLVVDIGGGSTEFVVGDGRGARRALGGHRLRADDRAAPRARRRRHRPADRGADRAPCAPTSTPRSTCAERTVPLREARTLVGLAGSVTTVAAIALGLPAYDSDAPSTTPGSRVDRVRGDHRAAARAPPTPSARRSPSCTRAGST